MEGEEDIWERGAGEVVGLCHVVTQSAKYTKEDEQHKGNQGTNKGSK